MTDTGLEVGLHVLYIFYIWIIEAQFSFPKPCEYIWMFLHTRNINSTFLCMSCSVWESNQIKITSLQSSCSSNDLDLTVPSQRHESMADRLIYLCQMGLDQNCCFCSQNRCCHKFWHLHGELKCSRLTSCRQIGGQKMAGMQESMTKSQPDLLSTMMKVFNMFQINLQGYLSGNVWTLWKCDGWTERQVNSRMNGRTSQFPCQWRIWHQVYLLTPVRLWFFTQSLSNYYSEKCWSLLGADMMESCVELHNCMFLKMWPEQKGVWLLWHLQIQFVLQISLNYDPDCLTNDKSALVQPSLSLVLSLKPLSKPVTDGFTDGCNATKPLQVKCCHLLQFHPCWLINW